jgi:pilus assembly protein TadC
VALLLDLLAAVLSSGQPVDRSIAAVTRAASGVTDSEGSDRIRSAMMPLRKVGRLLELGADPALAWGSVDHLRAFKGVAAAGVRCADSGARLSGAIRTSAAELRAERQATALARAERVGVWSLLPLGACFLPAFVWIGIAPIVAATIDGALSGLPGR